MRRTAVFALLLPLLGGIAAAQPVTHPEIEPCKVTVVLAPPDVRAEIESWVDAEPRCKRQLEVRVVTTEDGLYLSAQDRDGHVRERVVPDAQSAAVLVVSWMADDSLGPDLPAPTPVERPQMVPPPTPVDDDDSPFGPPAVERHTRFHTLHSHRALMVGAIGSAEGHDLGARAQIDLLGGQQWFLGLAGGIREREGQARVVVGVTKAFGRFSVRAQIGLGVDLGNRRYGDGTREVMRDALMSTTPTTSTEPERHGLSPRAEAALLGKISLDRDWGLIGGPIVEAPLDGSRRVGVSVLLGVQHGL